MAWLSQVPPAVVLSVAAGLIAVGGLMMQLRRVLIDVRDLTEAVRDWALWRGETTQRLATAEKTLTDITRELAPRRKATT